jgi:hypothetical protein
MTLSFDEITVHTGVWQMTEYRALVESKWHGQTEALEKTPSHVRQHGIKPGFRDDNEGDRADIGEKWSTFPEPAGKKVLEN